MILLSILILQAYVGINLIMKLHKIVILNYLYTIILLSNFQLFKIN